MGQIDVSPATLEQWFDEGVAMGATTMTIITDTFPTPPEQYPRYAVPGETAETSGAMEIAGEVFRLDRPLAPQLGTPPRVTALGCGCCGPCGCA